MKLNWYSGNKDRNKLALQLLQDLKKEFMKSDKINNLFDFYIKELKEEQFPISSILNQFNLSLSNYLSINSIQLTDKQSKIIKELQSISNIRYGYRI